MARQISQQQMSRLGAYYAAKQVAGGPLISTPTVYDVAKPTSNPTFIQLTGGVNRAAVRFDTGNAYIGSKPMEFIFYWKKISIATSGYIVVCIRKASDDSIAATLAEWPVPIEQAVNELNTEQLEDSITMQ